MYRTQRRNFLCLAGTATLTASIPKAFLINTASAQNIPHLRLDDPTAKALGYVHDTANVDSDKNPHHKATQVCSNCTLIQASDGDWRPCAIFPGKNVNANGWCKSWAQKP